MSGDDALDPRKLTFSQANGYVELPKPLKLEELSSEARNQLWSLLYTYVKEDSRFLTSRYVDGAWKSILESIHLLLFNSPTDQYSPSFEDFCRQYNKIFMYDSFNKIFDVLQHIMQHKQCPPSFTKDIMEIFSRCQLAYVVDIKPPAIIYPAASKAEGESVLRAIEELRCAGLEGAVTHLGDASKCINQKDYSGAIRESIHAVESSARQLCRRAKTLEQALKTLEKRNGLHPALKNAFSSLYGYASDEEGIRHALIYNSQANVGLDEALFMLGACASFSSYLARKYHALAS